MDKLPIHIISFDVPWPADYGGAIDAMYCIESLHKLGYEITLHCFTKGRAEQEYLKQFCKEVYYYKRKKIPAFALPYNISSRKSRKLKKRIEQDNHPILALNAHSSFTIFKNKKKNRITMIRLQNVEHAYFNELALHEHNSVKKKYFLQESHRYFKYEQKIANKAILFPLSKKDEQLFVEEFGAKEIEFVPCFIPWQKVESKSGIGDYALYHGNLAVNENEEAVVWLIQEVFGKIKTQLIVAGKNPSKRLQHIISEYPQIKLIENPDDEQLDELIENAQVHVLPSLNHTGVKLKILHALYKGRHVIVNSNAVEGSALEEICIIANETESYKNAVVQLMQQPFDENEKKHRITYLDAMYNNEKNAQIISAYLQKKRQ